MQPETMSSSDETLAVDPEVTHSNNESSTTDRKKSSKPVMEKRRRARINSSLNELKSILLEAMKKDSTRHSKLEKADILEMTVNYLKNIERQRHSMSLSIDPGVVDKYKAGFNECRNEVMRFLSTCEGVTVEVRTKLLSHLASCIRCIQSIQNQPNIFDDNGFKSMSIDHTILPSASSLHPPAIHDFNSSSTFSSFGPDEIAHRSTGHPDSNNNTPRTVIIPRTLDLPTIGTTLGSEQIISNQTEIRIIEETNKQKGSATFVPTTSCKDVEAFPARFSSDSVNNPFDRNFSTPEKTKFYPFNKPINHRSSKVSSKLNHDSSNVIFPTSKILAMQQHSQFSQSFSDPHQRNANSILGGTSENKNYLQCKRKSNDSSEADSKRNKSNVHLIEETSRKVKDKKLNKEVDIDDMKNSHCRINKLNKDQESFYRQKHDKVVKDDYSVTSLSQLKNYDSISNFKISENVKRTSNIECSKRGFYYQNLMTQTATNEGAKKICPWRPWSDGTLI